MKTCRDFSAGRQLMVRSYLNSSHHAWSEPMMRRIHANSETREESNFSRRSTEAQKQIIFLLQSGNRPDHS